MAMKFSSMQQLAIDSTGQNIIVSAGAGSGKTAVLTERIKRILLKGIKANELLVLTFTNAAAAEMKERVCKKMAEDELLKNRTVEIDSAYITTFDSFSLSIVKKYHDKLNLSTDISIIDNSILNVYKRKIIDKIFLKYYEENEENFASLITNFTTKDDATIKNEILNLANKIDLKTDRNEYLANYIEDNFNEKKFESYLSEFNNLLLSKIAYINQNCLILKENLEEEKYKKFIVNLELLLNSKNYNQIYDYHTIKLISFRNLPIEALNAKDNIKKALKELSDLCIYKNEKQIKDAYFQSQSYVKIVIDILKEYYQLIDNFKFQHQTFEFIDIAKMAIRLVKNNEDIKNELRDSFYEILVDEYQDTSDLQEEFISLISKNNVYMVGDIKQSIYGFRNANPLIFKTKYDNYRNNNGGMKIDLNQNFRSNRPVLYTINNIFNRIMDDDIGQAMFKKEHQMQFGLSKYEERSLENKIKYVSYQTDNNEYSKKDVDMFYVVLDIKKKINDGVIIFDKEKEIFRKCTYKDFAILLPDSSMFESLNMLLSYEKIPALVYKNVEVTKGCITVLIKNIIKLITLDYKKEYNKDFLHCFYSVGRSFIMNMTDEELFLCISQKTYQETNLYRKINELTLKVDSTSLTDLANQIVEKFDIINKIITIGDIDDNITRVEYTLNIISSLEKMELTIFDFVEYIDSILQSNDKIEFKSSGIDDDKVKIMTIHKSKGLEFPIVYFINNDKTFNKSEFREKLIYDNKYGIITPYYIDGIGKNINYFLMVENNNIAMISEKIRLLYVALTRAREQMIILNSYSKDKPSDLSEEIVSKSIRKEYNSFSSIYNSICNVFKDIEEELEVEKLDIDDSYLYNQVFSRNNDAFSGKNQKITYIDNNIEVIEINKSHASKETKSLKDMSSQKIMDYGSNIHKLFEITDFLNVKYDLLKPNEKKIITNFLNQPILNNLKNGKIYKEYEFIDNINDKNQIHGIIDLMIEYDNYIDIIDYKLSSIEDEAYIDQLNKYKEYIARKSKKEVNIYLYSISKNFMRKIEI